MKYFELRNWSKYQHYKDRNPPWVKLYTAWPDDYEWSCWSDASKLLAVCIVMLAGRVQNRIPLDPTWIQQRCGLKKTPDLAELFSVGFIQEIQSLPSAEQDASKLLAECEQDASNPLPLARSREAEQSREETDKTPLPPKGAAAAPNLHEQIIATYHEVLTDLPAVRDWPERRRRKLAARIAERVKAGKPADKPEYWRALFTQVQASDFLCGRKSDWRCPGLEWLLEPKNFTKVIEGAYRNNDGMNGHAR